jgi:hypothetical protein
MTLQESYNLFESLKTDTINKSEIKIYEKFQHLLSQLKTRNFSKEEVNILETELDSFNLNSNPENRKKFFKSALNKFETFLKDTFSLTSKGYYTKLYGGLGLSFGLLFGIVFLSSWERSLSISLGLIIGMVIGAIIGQSKDTKAKSESRTL